MLKLNPLSVLADGQNEKGHYRYRVRFQSDEGEREYLFFVESIKEGLEVLTCDPEFLKVTRGDPAVNTLRKSVLLFHQARHYEYSDRETPV